jgi:hypothetical protein
MNRNITQDIITDLLPAYFSGEASPATKTMVEDYFAADPTFAGCVQSEWKGSDGRAPANPPLITNHAGEALTRTKHIIRVRTLLFAIALFLSLLPCTFVVNSERGVTFLMMRDAPAMAFSSLVGGAVLWIWYAIYTRRLRTAGL